MTAPAPAAAPAPHRARARRRLEALLGVPFTEGNAVEVLCNGDEVFPALLSQVAAAERSVDLLWFRWGQGEVTDRVADALAARARDGVRVRVMLDGFGAHGIAREQVRRMRDAGCLVSFFRPFRGGRVTTFNLRTHRRVLVCDEHVAITGGTGIDQSWTGDGRSPGSWRDTAFRVRGPAVDGVRSAFALDWMQSPHPVVTADDRFPDHGRPGDVAVQVLAPSSQPGWNLAALALVSLLETAERHVRIATPYARLPERLHRALADAVRRGVRVQLLMTAAEHAERPFVALQSRHHYSRLLDDGIELWLYQPTLLHQKTVTVDGCLAMVGTTNLDVRSVVLNEQVGLVLDDAGLTRLLERQFDEDLQHSARLDGERWRNRPVLQRLVETAAGVVGTPLQGLGTQGQTGPRP